jgi:hypothetical protein
VDDLTAAAKPLRAALAQAERASTGLLALGIPLCPSCELLATSLDEIARARPGVSVHIAALTDPREWADREELLWPRGIHVSRASVPVLALFRAGEVVATRQGGGPASTIDAWLSAHLGPPAAPLESGVSAAETTRLTELTDLRRRRLTPRQRAPID